MASRTPFEGRFAVIRIDPVASVAHLNDTEATESAKALESKCYLVYISAHESLQFFRNSFSVSPIAKTLRDIEEQYGCTPEMCMPIFPNDTHPTGRPALHTEPTFPYSGCYIWTFAETQVRVAEREEGWKTREAVRLPPIHEVKMQRTWGLDYAKIEAVIKPSRVTTKKPIVDVATAYSYLSSGTDYSCGSVTGSSEESADEPGGSGFRLSASQEADFHPVVELWYELTEHLKDDDIPHPSELRAETARIDSIIKAARERSQSAELPDLDTSAFRPLERRRVTTNKNIEEFLRQLEASNSKQKRR